MILLIDGTNLINGGGVSHISEMLNHTSDETIRINNIDKVYIIGVKSTLQKIHDRDWLKKIDMLSYSSSVIKRLIWKKKYLTEFIEKNKINFIFNPGGGFIGKIPYVTMCRNMLVFEKEEALRYDSIKLRLRFKLLNWLQTKSFTNAKGVIFISKYAQHYVRDLLKIPISNSTVIHHGVSGRFDFPVKEQKSIQNFTKINPLKLLYVSRTDPYKHHEKVARAIIELYNEKGYNIEYIVVGEKGYSHELFEKERLKNPSLIKYLGKISFEDIHSLYMNSNIFIFASTCENMPNILIEAMSSGLPIVCSKKLPMPEFLRDGGVYFDALSVDSIKKGLNDIIENATLRKEIAEKSKKLSQEYNWKKCSEDTFEFLSYCFKKKD